MGKRYYQYGRLFVETCLTLNKIPKEQILETLEFEKLIYFLKFSPYLEAVSIEKILKGIQEDKQLLALKKKLRTGKEEHNKSLLKPFEKIISQMTITDTGLILKSDRIVLPEALIKNAIQKAHQGGHPGIAALIRRLRTTFWFPEMSKRVTQIVRNCKICTMFTPKNKKNRLHAQGIEKHGPWEKVSIDLFGPMPDSKYVIVVQDMVSKFPAAKILSKTDAEPTMGAIKDIYNAYSTPLIHLTDNPSNLSLEKRLKK